MPRVAAVLDTSQVSDIIKVISPDTFLRPIYAGNAFATVKSKDQKKCITIRPTSFDPAPSSGGSAEIVKGESGQASSLLKFIKREEVKSDRPELGTARVESIPMKMSETPWSLDRPPPLIGEHSAEIYTELLGVSPEELATLYEEGIA